MTREPDNIEVILAEAVKLQAADERERYLQQACGDDSQLRREVTQLVNVHFATNQYFQNPDFDESLIHNPQSDDADEFLSDPPLANGGILGDYQLVRQIGRGGMGVVYEAEQISLKRKVALKVLPFAAVLDQRQLTRFKTEAQAAAGLHHGNIVPVYQVGCERAVHFYAMQFIEGQDVSELIRQLRKITQRNQTEEQSSGDSGFSLATQLVSGQFTPVAPTTRIGNQADSNDAPITKSSSLGSTAIHDDNPPSALSTIESVTKPEFFRTIAGLGIQAAEALEFAHQRGVLHRDIKPSNLMLDAEGKIWITDFGLARVEGDAGLTMTGDVMGTLRYMSPEQAGGLNAIVNQRSDVYSLGVTLYEMLTLRPIFAGCDRNELLQNLAQEEPTPPRQIKRSLPTDLETIVLTAIAKKPDDRYATAQELADDLRRFLDNIPIVAKRPSVVKRVTKWGQRHRSLSASLAILLLAALISGSVVFGVISGNIHSPPISPPLLGQPDGKAQSRGGPTGLPYSGEFLPGLVPEPTSVSGMGLWQLATKRPRGVLQSGVFSPDEKLIAVGEAGNIRIYDATNLRLLHLLVGHSHHVSSIAWHPSSRQLASASWDGTVRLWTADGLPTDVLNGHVGAVYCVAWHPDGEQLASAGAGGTIRIWNADGTNAGLLRSHRDHVFCLAFSPDGKLLASAGGDIRPPDENGNPGDNAIRLWNLAEERVTALLQGHDLTVRCLAWKPDGTQLATGDGNVFRTLGPTGRNAGTLRVWNPDGTAGPVVSGNFRGIHALTWSPDGRRIIFGGRKDDIWAWDDAQPTQVTTFTIHGTDINSITWNSSGSRLLTTNRSSIMVWEADGHQRHALRGLLDGPRFLDVNFSPDGKWITSRARIWQADGTPGPVLKGVEQPVVWSPDGKRLAAVGADSTVQLLDQDYSLIQPLTKHDSYITDFDWSHDGRRLASTAGDGTTRVWDFNNNTSKILKATEAAGVHRQFRTVEFSPDDQMIAAASWGDAAVHVWNQTGNIHALLKGHRGGVESVGWSPDGRLLVTGGGLTVRLWKSENGILHKVLTGHTDEIYPVACSPDGRWIASGSSDGTVRIWHANGNPKAILRGHHGGIHSLAWSPDSQLLASASWLDSTLRMWNIQTQKTEWILLSLDDVGTTVTLSPSGELLHGDRDVAAEELRYLMEQDTGEVSVLTYSEFHDQHTDAMIRHFGKLCRLAVRRKEYDNAVAKWEQMLSFGSGQRNEDLREYVTTIVGDLLSESQHEHVLALLSSVIQFDRTIIAADPNNEKLLKHLLADLTRRRDLLSYLERYEGALADALETQKLDPENQLHYTFSGQMRWRLEQYDLAIQDLEKSHRLDPNHTAAMVEYAHALVNHPDPNQLDAQRAATLSQRACELDPKLEAARSVLGMAMYRLENWEAAIDAHQQAIRLRKQVVYSPDYFVTAMAHWQIGHQTEAEDWFNRGVKGMENYHQRKPDIIRWYDEAKELLGIETEKP